ncbi:hypothetical protein SISNIDRAFT_460482 [Sistotremastrum niveocremeum HHB9708]|uniref:Uncharacterized protein n=1 Tax=Sistotremastrum niveocremeum HHB9708 TaxID=1314777 RepID=A0A164NNU2_9AGAM|nr:hypothetical protein SISNIDRAFT_460482 [Sistotremastrum niveocremeum HHB9708]
MISSATTRRAFTSLTRASTARYASSINTVGPSSRKSPLQNMDENTYAKQDDPMGHPTISDAGTRTYVVSEPDPKGTKYDIPGYVYKSTSPYNIQETTSAPSTQLSSSSSAAPAHPKLTKQAPQNPDGVGSSSAVRYRSAPGEMSGGGDGGLGLMDESSTRNLEQSGMAERNPAPKGAEEGKLGLKEAWKHRK